MAVMNIVWPVTALFGTLLTVWGYAHYGRQSSRKATQRAKAAHAKMPSKSQPFAAVVGKGALHCGAGCMIGDLVASGSPSRSRPSPCGSAEAPRLALNARYSIALTMSSTTFFASPKTIIVLSM